MPFYTVTKKAFVGAELIYPGQTVYFVTAPSDPNFTLVSAPVVPIVGQEGNRTLPLSAEDQALQTQISNAPGLGGATAYSSLTGVPAAFPPVIASLVTVGGVKQGAGVAIAGDGTLSVTASGVSTAQDMIAAAGSTQGTATQLTKGFSRVIFGSGGVAAPPFVAGVVNQVCNDTGAPIDLYPPPASGVALFYAIQSAGAAASALAANAPVQIPVGVVVSVGALSTSAARVY